jgi:hypothetical protein
LGGASLAVRTSLEEVVRLCTQRGLLPPSVFGSLWEIVAFGVASLARTRIGVAALVSTVAKSGGTKNATADAETALRSQVATMDNTLQRARAALCLLGMVASAAPETVDSAAGLARIYAVLHPLPIAGFPSGIETFKAAVALLGPSVDTRLLEAAIGLGDYRLARHACAALQRFAGLSVVSVAKRPGAEALTPTAAPAPVPAKSKTAAASKGKGAKAESETSAGSRPEVLNHIFSAVAAMVRGDWDGGDVENPHWYAAAQQGIDAIFALAPAPVAMCTEILQTMATQAVTTTTTTATSGSSGSGGGKAAAGSLSSLAFSNEVSRARLSRLFFVLGHVAMKLIVHVEMLASRIKLVRIRAGERAEHNAAQGTTDSASSSSAASGKGVAKGGKAAAAPGKNSAANDGIEEQLGVSAAEDEKEAELVVSIAEKEVVAANLGGLFAPLLQSVAKGLLTQRHASAKEVDADPLAQSALLALCKLMAVSSEFCESQLQLLFTVLAQAPSPSIRRVVVIALGDLAARFPNLVEPYTGHLYARLRDADAGVRKNTLMVLTHLILNDMVKVKGQVGEIAVCLNDPEPRVADLTRMVSMLAFHQRKNKQCIQGLPRWAEIDGQ